MIKKTFLALILCSIALTAYANCTSKPAKRIISLAPSLTELLYSIGAGKQIIGVSTSSDYPAAARHLRRVADYQHLDLEKIVSLQPDLVLAWQGGNPQAQLDKLAQFSIPIVYSKVTKLQQIPVLLRKLGCLTGHVKRANQKAQQFENTYQELKHKHAKQKKQTVFYELWSKPLMTLNKTSLVNDMINTCGGKNIFANTLSRAPEVSPESVIAAKPAVIIASTSHWQHTWQQWPEIPAVKNHRLVTINPDYLLRPSYRSLLGLKAVCAAINP